MNNQRPEPATKGDGTVLDVHSIFYTIQGEGPFTGHPAAFIRLAGCNLQCPGCDTEYTEGRRVMNVYEIENLVVRKWDGIAQKQPLVVITGGEPLRQPIGVLCNLLVKRDYRVQIESNGVFAPDEMVLGLMQSTEKVFLIVSPKTTRVNKIAASFASAFKYVLDAESVSSKDGLPIKALDHPAATGVARPAAGFDGLVYLNPFDAKDEARNAANLRAVAKSCMEFGYIAGVQMHKIIGLD